MTYDQALEKIHSLLHFGSRPGLDRILKLLSLIDDPQNKCRFVHVAGTNGKGSVCQLINSVLTAAGYKTGLFISPYITDFRERIQINSKFIPKQELARAVEYIFPFIEKMAAEGDIITEFEFVNAIAFYYFFKEKCDIVVLETGMVLVQSSRPPIPPPLCSVITPIDLDHTAVLGSTVEEITRQKCGIIKEKSFTVMAKQPSKDIERQIIQDCTAKHNCCFFAEDCKLRVLSSGLSGTEVKYKHKKFTLPLLGRHQTDNLKTALTTLELLREQHYFSITREDIVLGVEGTVHPARFELISRSPAVILDGAHNPNGMQAFADSVDEYLGDRKKILIIGMLRDKDIHTALDFISGKFSHVITLTVDNPRTITAEELAELCKARFDSVTAAASAQEAVQLAGQLCREDGSALLVCGSLYLAGELRPLLQKYFQPTE